MVEWAGIVGGRSFDANSLDANSLDANSFDATGYNLKQLLI